MTYRQKAASDKTQWSIHKDKYFLDLIDHINADNMWENNNN